MIFADTPTLGLLIGLPIGLLIAGVCGIVSLVAGVGWAKTRDTYTGGELGAVSIIAAVCCFIALGVTGFAMWPWKHDYHFWIEKSGTVQAVDKRLVPAGDNGMQEKIVVTIADQPYGIVDTRASLLKPGDWVSINCKKAYEWGSSNHGWDCRWNNADYKNRSN